MKVVVQFTNGNYANIPATRMERDENFACVFSETALVAIIDLASIDYIYLSEVKANG